MTSHEDRQEAGTGAGLAFDAAERMRAAFDGSFSEPARQAVPGVRDFALVAAGGAQWALTLEGLCGIEHGRALVPVPSGRAAFVGVAGVGSTAVPVFDLAALADGGARQVGAGESGRAPVFALLETGPAQAGPGGRVGVAFDRLLQFARVAPGAVLRPAGLGAGRPTLEHEDELYFIIEAEELLRHILSGHVGSPGAAARAGARPSEQARPGDPTK